MKTAPRWAEKCKQRTGRRLGSVVSRKNEIVRNPSGSNGALESADAATFLFVDGWASDKKGLRDIRQL